MYKLKKWIDINNLDWICLSGNPNAIDLLEQNPNKIHLTSLCQNPNAIHILEKNQHKIYWEILSENHNAIRILEKSAHYKINFEHKLKNQILNKLINNEKLSIVFIFFLL